MTGRGQDELSSLVYTSAAATPFSGDDLEGLLVHARAANDEAGITGLLLYRSGRFVQFIEGPRDRVSELMTRIRDDSRHTNVRVLVDGSPAARQFPDWTMGYEPMDSRVGPAPDGFRDTFEDLENIDDTDVVLRAARELTLWFRVRTLQRDRTG